MTAKDLTRYLYEMCAYISLNL